MERSLTLSTVVSLNLLQSIETWSKKTKKVHRKLLKFLNILFYFFRYFITFFSSLAWTFFILENSNTFASASIARPSIYPMDSPRSFLESINGTRNFRMHGKKAKDDKWIWDGREGSRYIYCVREATSKCEELEYTKQCFGQNIPYPSTTLDLTNYFSQDQSLEKLISYQALKHGKQFILIFFWCSAKFMFLFSSKMLVSDSTISLCCLLSEMWEDQQCRHGLSSFTRNVQENDRAVSDSLQQQLLSWLSQMQRD